MNFEPRLSEAVGRLVIRKPKSAIIRPDPTKVTKMVILDAVGPDAARSGLSPGDIVLPTKVDLLWLDDGTVARPILTEKDVRLIARDWGSRDEFHVQIDNASKYVPFDDPRAAAPYGAPPLRLVPPPPSAEGTPEAAPIPESSASQVQDARFPLRAQVAPTPPDVPCP